VTEKGALRGKDYFPLIEGNGGGCKSALGVLREEESVRKICPSRALIVFFQWAMIMRRARRAKKETAAGENCLILRRRATGAKQ